MATTRPGRIRAATGVADGGASLAGRLPSTGQRDGEPPVHPGRAAAWLGKQVEVALSTVELSLPQYRALALLDEGSAMSSALAERLAVRPASVTAVVDGLVGRGLVHRRPDAVDRRRVGLVLTAKGRRWLADADAATGQRLAEIARQLDDPALTTAALDSLGVWRRAITLHWTARRRRS